MIEYSKALLENQAPTRTSLGVLAVALLTIVPLSVNAEDHTGIPLILSDANVMAEQPLPDFSYAGYNYGMGELPQFDHVINVADYGAVADDNSDDSAALRAALAAAAEHDGPVRVQLGKGRYQLTEILWLENSNIVLAGMGMGEGGTELFMPRPLKQIDDAGTLDNVRKYNENRYEVSKRLNLRRKFSEYSWSGGFIWAKAAEGDPADYGQDLGQQLKVAADILAGEQFGRTVTVADASDLRPGQVLKILWYNREGKDGPLITSIYGNTDLEIGNSHWSNPDRPLLQQQTRIETVSGNTVTIANPLLHPINSQIPANFSPWSHLTNIGIEDIAFVFPENPYFGHHNEDGYNAIYLTGVHNGWVRNIRFENADSAVLSDDLANITMRNLIVKGGQKGHYGISISRSHNVLVEGAQIFNDTHHSLSFNTLTTRSVFKDSVVWTNPSIDQHGGANHQNLTDNVLLFAAPSGKAADGSPMIDIFNRGGGSGWHPGHGRFNTHWNMEVVLTESVPASQHVTIKPMRVGGVDPRIIGLHGSRPLKLDYPPNPYIEMMGEPVRAIPSLYDYQLSQREAEGAK